MILLSKVLLGVFSSSNKSRSCWIFSVLSKVDYLASSLRKYIESTFEGSYDMIFIYDII